MKRHLRVIPSQGFTLVQLLVVIAIIGINRFVVACRAGTRRPRAQCTNNLNSWGSRFYTIHNALPAKFFRLSGFIAL